MYDKTPKIIRTECRQSVWYLVRLCQIKRLSFTTTHQFKTLRWFVTDIVAHVCYVSWQPLQWQTNPFLTVTIIG